jgi:protein-L-isoaspartate(D-aspartate) O-methyltransferase
VEDSYKHKGMRKQLVKEVASKGISSQAVLDAIGKIPRHFFFDPIFDIHAYEDKAFPIDEGQTISQPYTVAYQTELLEVENGHKILEIGTGSGYQACVLLALGAEVHTIEYHKKLYDKARRMLPPMGYHPHFYHGDGSLGLKEAAPYDAIVVTAAAPAVPEELIRQLKTGGRLVIPVGDNRSQQMMRIRKISDTKVARELFAMFRFVPLRGNKGWK